MIGKKTGKGYNFDTPTLRQVLIPISLLSAFTFPAVASYTAVYITILGLIFLSTDALRLDSSVIVEPPFIALIAALISVTLSVLVTGPLQPMNWLTPIVLLIPLLSIGFKSMGISRTNFRMEWVAILCLAGAALGVCAGLYEVRISPNTRVGLGNNPIHYGGLMLLLGFAALGGYAISQGKLRHMFILGPVLGISGVFLSGARGAGIAAIALLAALAPVFIVWSRRDRGFIIAVLSFSILGAILFSVSPQGHRAATGLFVFMSGVIEGDFSLIDQSRTDMLNGALAAFLESPVWGHGWAEMMAAAERHYPADSPYVGDYDHLHSDIANFAVIGGLLGLLAYALLIGAPIIAAFLSPPRSRFPVVVLATVTSVGYFALGLTNSMFGILPQTVLYTALLGWILALAADDEGEAERT